MTGMFPAMNAPRADVGWIVRTTINVVRRRAIGLLMIGLPTIWLPSLLAALLPPELAPLRYATGMPALVFFGGASLLAYREITGGERVGGLRALGVGLRRFVTLFLIAMVSGFMAVVGLALLVVPGLFVLAAFMAATTAAVAEDKGSAAAMDRAWLLSRGSRGRLAGLMGIALVAYVLMLVFALLAAAIVSLIGLMDTVLPVDQLVMAPIINMALFSMTTVGATAAYVNLRTLKEGEIDLAEAFA
ncbi:MAG TPA: hypothetical protein VMT68_10090 [Caulobacteraceae bacterium]|nr:hypothetical protein [Caulobacteraceae bacterium]